MFTLDVLDFLTEVEDHLESRMGKAERKMARRELRRLIEDFAFRFAFMDGRVMPEEVDYVRALECLKSPEAAAEVLLRRAPVYRRRKARSRVVTVSVLALLLVAGVAFAQFLATEEGNVVLHRQYSVGVAERGEFDTGVDSFSFNVSEDASRLLVMNSVTLTDGDVTVTLVSPSGEQPLRHVFVPKQGSEKRVVVEDPEPGTWTLDVAKRDAAGVLEFWAQTVHPSS